MRHVVIPEAGLEWNIPSDLSECNSKEYIDMCGLIYKLHIGTIDYLQLRLQAVYKLFGLQRSPKKLDSNEEECKWSNIDRLSTHIDHYFEENESGQIVLKQYYIHNPVPSIALLRRYHGPSDQFLNMKFGEYLDALRLFHEFPTTGDTKTLFLINAILYRPAKLFHRVRKYFNNYDGDIRVSYNSNHIDARANTFKAFPMGFIYGTYLLFASFQKFLSTAKIPWGGREIDFSILFDSSGDELEEIVPGIGMDSLMFALAENGTFGNAESVRNTSLWEILIRLYDLRKKSLDEEKRAQNDRRSET